MAYGTVNTPGVPNPLPIEDGGTGADTAGKALKTLINGAYAYPYFPGDDAIIPILTDTAADNASKVSIATLKRVFSFGFRVKITFDPAFANSDSWYRIDRDDGSGWNDNRTVPPGLVDVVELGDAAANMSYTVTAKADDGEYYSAHFTIGEEQGQYEVEMRPVRIYGARWDGTSTTKWTRTDDAANFTDPNPWVSPGGPLGSPFDELKPWSGMVTSERTGGTMVAIPKFWYKITQSGKGLQVQIADKATDGFSVSPAHMDRGDGKGERDTVYVGRYHCGTTDYKSKTGVVPKHTVTRSAARTAIHALGANIWQMDFAMRFTIWLLYIVEFADWNSQACIGYGCGDGSSAKAMGYTDSMPYHTGTTQTSRTTYGLGTQYRNIEGLWDNVLDWCDGCYYNANGLNIILNPAEFSDTENGVCIGKPKNGYPKAFAVTTVAGFPAFIPSASGGSDTSYSCDSWSYDSSDPCLCVGGYYYQYSYYGLFYVDYSGVSYAYDSIGCRLQELP